MVTWVNSCEKKQLSDDSGWWFSLWSGALKSFPPRKSAGWSSNHPKYCVKIKHVVPPTSHLVRSNDDFMVMMWWPVVMIWFYGHDPIGAWCYYADDQCWAHKFSNASRGESHVIERLRAPSGLSQLRWAVVFQQSCWCLWSSVASELSRLRTYADQVGELPHVELEAQIFESTNQLRSAKVSHISTMQKCGDQCSGFNRLDPRTIRTSECGFSHALWFTSLTWVDTEYARMTKLKFNQKAEPKCNHKKHYLQTWSNIPSWPAYLFPYNRIILLSLRN